ncbi:MAG TPA: alpha/beta hydrolase [Candidatus Sulfopaludibacter sp.]|jgi:epoxide hydrolase 4|nr:alpha/beta hydrolase [Candidatus Sulfopaludibacter sp.]
MSNDLDSLQHKFVNVNGIRMHYVTIESEVCDSSDCPLMILLHGFPEFWYSWRHQIPFFAKRFRVVAPDMRGYGETEKPREISEYRIDKLVRDIIELIHSVGKEKAIIVGHDWGAIIGWSIAMIAPSMVEKLIIMNAPHPAIYQKNAFRNLPQMQKSWYIFFFLMQKAPEKVLSSNNFELLKHMFESSIKRKDKFTYDDIKNYISSWRNVKGEKDKGSNFDGISGGINYYRANLNTEFWENLGESIPFPKIKSPTLLIWGEDDMFLGKELAENTKECIEAPFSMKFISNCGHWIQQEAPDEVNQVMSEFLNN